MMLDYAAKVAIGPKETNDDRTLIDAKILDMTSAEGKLYSPATVAVCDGCGGYDGGGTAAQTVLELLSRESPEALQNPEYLSQVLYQCEQAIEYKKIENPAYSKMCTTIAGCIFSDDSTVIFHSGDSRVYRCDNWGLAKMTIDHSVVREMIDAGQITEEEALTSPVRNIITRCLGTKSMPPEIYISNAAIAPGEKFLICSDGLWEYVSEEQINKVLSEDISLIEMADILVDTALTQGGDDNISVCICAAPGNTNADESTPFILE